MTHDPHPDVHTHGLADNCVRCADLALAPGNLDQEAYGDLIDRTIRWYTGGREDSRPRSETEALAMSVVYNTLNAAGRIAEVAPLQLAQYLNHRWRVAFTHIPRED